MYQTAFLDLPHLATASGSVQLPGSKSISNRVLLLAALSAGTTTIHDLLDSDDTRVMLAALRELGLAIPQAQANFVWIPETGQAPGGVADALALAADFSEAGTLVRPFAGVGVRVSVGEPESVPVVIDIVRQHLAQR